MADEPLAQASTGRGADQARAYRAFLMVVDVVGFSQLTLVQQVEVVEHLASGLRALALLEDRDPASFVLNSTGDGFLVAVTVDGPLNLPLTLCDVATQLVLHCRDYELGPHAATPTLQIRVGLHVGDVIGDAVEVAGTRFAVGVGLNWCSRVADLAGPDQVLVSEVFVQLVVQRWGRDLAGQRFFPDQDFAPFQAEVKHGRKAEVRMLLGDGLSDAAPPKLAVLDMVRQHLLRALLIMGKTLCLHLGAVDEALTLKALAPRLTLWVRRDGVLEPREPRCILPYVDDTATPLPRTRYRLPPTGAEAGPLGWWPVIEAWQTNAPAWVLDLPDFDDEPNAYLLACRARGLGAAQVVGFTRKSRSVVAIPLTLFEAPVAVLCLDLAAELADHERVVEEAIATLQVRSSYLVASLMHLVGE